MASKFLNTRRRESLLSTVWGGMWGVVVGGVIVTVASQLAVRHDLVLPKPEARAVETPAGTEFDQARPETDPELPSEETVPAADIVAGTPAQPGPADTSPQFDTTPAAAPRTRFDGPAAPDRPNVPGGANVNLTRREALRPETGIAPEAAAPLPPAAERNVAVARDTPAPPISNPDTETAPSAATQTEAPQSPPVALAEPEATPPASEAPPPVDIADAVPAQPEANPGAAPLTEVVSAAAPELILAEPDRPEDPVAEDTLTAEVPAPLAVRDPAGPAPAAPAVETPEAAPSVSSTPADQEFLAPEDDTAAIGIAEVETTPDLVVPDAPSAPPAAANVPQTPRAVSETPTLVQTSEPRRLAPDNRAPSAPAIGTPATRLGTTADEANTASPASAAPASSRALIANRSDFTPDPAVPKLAVVLTHQGDQLPDPSALGDLPAEISFAVDARAANAPEIAAAYRSAGREVVVIPSFPPRATPQDIEVALGTNLADINGAVAVMDPGSAGFQNDRVAVGQVIAVLAETGHGLITAARGLNTAQQIADRFDVPAALIFSELGLSPDAGAAARALDRVAFRARQEMGIIVLGAADATTAQGIAEWVQGRSSAGLQLAPVSAVIAPLETDPVVEAQDEAPAGGLPQVRRLPQIQSQ